MKAFWAKKYIFLVFLTLFVCFNTQALEYSDVTSVMTELGYFDSSKNEGTTSFRSLLIPIGGRPESLGSAYTGLCDDAGYINYNAAASSIIGET